MNMGMSNQLKLQPRNSELKLLEILKWKCILVINQSDNTHLYFPADVNWVKLHNCILMCMSVLLSLDTQLEVVSSLKKAQL